MTLITTNFIVFQPHQSMFVFDVYACMLDTREEVGVTTDPGLAMMAGGYPATDSFVLEELQELDRYQIENSERIRAEWAARRARWEAEDAEWV